jgi:ribosomal protein S18 acetylase RimI-like enzyme
MPKSTLEADPWLGGMLGRKAFRLTFPTAPTAPAGTFPTAILATGTGPDIITQAPPPTREAVFIYAKIDVENPGQTAWLERLGFHLVDTNITFEKILEPGAWTGREPPGIRLAEPEDEAAAVRLARTSFRKSRFHNDPGIPPDTADRIKSEWVRNYFLGARGDAMAVCEAAGGLAGFLLLLKSDEALTIDLVAVDEAQRGKALAGAMTRFLESRFPGPAKVRVGTQIANGPAIRAYQKMGFVLARSQYIFHYHGPMPAALTGKDP